MSDFGTDKNTQFAEDKAKNKLDEIAGSAQQQFGEFVDSPKHQVKGAAKKYAAQAKGKPIMAAIFRTSTSRKPNDL